MAAMSPYDRQGSLPSAGPYWGGGPVQLTPPQMAGGTLRPVQTSPSSGVGGPYIGYAAPYNYGGTKTVAGSSPALSGGYEPDRMAAPGSPLLGMQPRGGA